MYELIQAAEHTYYIQCPAKMGLWVPDGQHAVLIDSGNDKDAGRKVQKLLEAQGWALTAILNTHANADHNGGNALLQQRLGAPPSHSIDRRRYTYRTMVECLRQCEEEGKLPSDCTPEWLSDFLFRHFHFPCKFLRRRISAILLQQLPRYPD